MYHVGVHTFGFSYHQNDNAFLQVPFTVQEVYTDVINVHCESKNRLTRTQ